jgi:hypothetical protein
VCAAGSSPGCGRSPPGSATRLACRRIRQRPLAVADRQTRQLGRAGSRSVLIQSCPLISASIVAHPPAAPCVLLFPLKGIARQAPRNPADTRGQISSSTHRHSRCVCRGSPGTSAEAGFDTAPMGLSLLRRMMNRGERRLPLGCFRRSPQTRCRTGRRRSGVQRCITATWPACAPNSNRLCALPGFERIKDNVKFGVTGGRPARRPVRGQRRRAPAPAG